MAPPVAPPVAPPAAAPLPAMAPLSAVASPSASAEVAAVEAVEPQHAWPASMEGAASGAPLQAVVATLAMGYASGPPCSLRSSESTAEQHEISISDGSQNGYRQIISKCFPHINPQMTQCIDPYKHRFFKIHTSTDPSQFRKQKLYNEIMSERHTQPTQPIHSQTHSAHPAHQAHPAHPAHPSTDDFMTDSIHTYYILTH